MAESEALVMIPKMLNGKDIVLDVHPLVLCKCCKFHGTYDCNITWHTKKKTEDNWFCADGKRRKKK